MLDRADTVSNSRDHRLPPEHENGKAGYIDGDNIPSSSHLKPPGTVTYLMHPCELRDG
jgi:hypothetical protein